MAGKSNGFVALTIAGKVAVIALTQGKRTLIDADDAPRVMAEGKWMALGDTYRTGRHFYAVRAAPKINEDGVRFRQLDGPVPEALPECQPEKVAQIESEVQRALLGGS